MGPRSPPAWHSQGTPLSSVFPKNPPPADPRACRATPNTDSHVESTQLRGKSLFLQVSAAFSHSSSTIAPKAPAGSENPPFPTRIIRLSQEKRGSCGMDPSRTLHNPQYLILLGLKKSTFPRNKRFSSHVFLELSLSCHWHIRTGAAAPGLLHTNPRTRECFRSGREFPASVSASKSFSCWQWPVGSTAAP